MKTRAFTLVEVTLALGLAAFCLIGLLGLLPLGASQNLEASRATAASNVVSSVLADLRATSSSAAATTIFKIALPSTTTGTVIPSEFYVTDAGEYLPAANSKTSTGQTARYHVLVRLTPPAVGRPEQAMGVYVKLWEPAIVSATQASNFTELATSVTQ